MLLLAGLLLGMAPQPALADTSALPGTETGSTAVPHPETPMPSSTAPAPGPDDQVREDGGFAQNWLEGRLQLGTRTVHRFLTDKDSGHKGGTYGTGTYLGTIYGLDEVQAYAPTRMFLAYYFTKNIGVEFAYDSMKVETVAVDSDTQKVKTDGDAILAGPTISLLGRYPNATALTPYAGIGLGFFKGDFDEDPAWAHEYWGTDDRNRQMVVDDTTALLLTAGATWAFNPHWLLDMSMQYVRADADAVFYGDVNGEVDTVQPGHFPMDNVALRLGITYSF